MKFHIFCDPRQPSEFAMFSHVGTWSDGDICEECGDVTSKLIAPLQIEWEPGTEKIGDFSWCGYTCVVLDKVKKHLRENGFEVRFGRVEVVRPTTKTKHPLVPFPYTGPRLYWMTPSRRLLLNEKLSRITVVRDCQTCGQKRYKFKTRGLVIDRAAWSGEKIFRIEQFGKSAATFITEQGLEILNQLRPTNLCPRLAGEIR